MDGDLHNRIARKILDALLGYSLEFGNHTTTLEPDTFGLTAEEFIQVVDTLDEKGLVERVGDESCVVTSRGLAVAKNQAELGRLFPVNGDPNEPLPSELAAFGTRSFETVSDAPPADFVERV